MKVELTAGKILTAEKIEKSKKLLKLTIFDGVKERTVASGISEYYAPDALIGKTLLLECSDKSGTYPAVTKEIEVISIG